MKRTLKVITNGSVGGYPIASARVYIGDGIYQGGEAINACTDENGEIEIDDDYLVFGNILRIRYANMETGLYLKPFECDWISAQKIFTSENPFSVLKDTVYMKRDIIINRYIMKDRPKVSDYFVRNTLDVDFYAYQNDLIEHIEYLNSEIIQKDKIIVRLADNMNAQQELLDKALETLNSIVHK